MFGKSSPKEKMTTIQPPRAERKEQSFLHSGVRIDGTVDVDGDLRVEGDLKGAINVRGVLMIGAKASAEGEIWGGEVVIHGKVTGDICAEQRVHLARGAAVKGDLYCKSLIIEDGVVFDGRSHMGERSPGKDNPKEAAIKNEEKTHNAQLGTQKQAVFTKPGLPSHPAPEKRDRPFSQSNESIERRAHK